MKDDLPVWRRRTYITIWFVTSTILMMTCLRLPAARVPYHVSSLHVEDRELTVYETLAGSKSVHWFWSGYFLLSIPLVSLIGCATLCFLHSPRKRSVWGFFLSVLILLPSIPIPRIWPGAVGWWRFALTIAALFTGHDTQFLQSYYCYLVLLFVVGIAFLLVGIQGLVELRSSYVRSG